MNELNVWVLDLGTMADNLERVHRKFLNDFWM